MLDFQGLHHVLVSLRVSVNCRNGFTKKVLCSGLITMSRRQVKINPHDRKKIVMGLSHWPLSRRSSSWEMPLYRNYNRSSVYIALRECVFVCVCLCVFYFILFIFILFCVFFLLVPCFASFSCFIACCLRFPYIFNFLYAWHFFSIQYRNPVVLFPVRRFVCWILSLCLKQ